MQLNEFNKIAQHNILVEEIEQSNDTGYLAEDIAAIIEAHQEDKWQKHTLEEACNHISKIAERVRNKKKGNQQ
jgi:hypothetical protein